MTHVAHIVFRFDYGGLENGVANVVNALSAEGFRHSVITLTTASEFKDRLHPPTQVYPLDKRPGWDLRMYYRLFRLLRQLRPDIVHTRNIGTMDCAFIALCAGVRIRVHGEHGWDTHDPDGTRFKYRFLRRLLSPLVHRVVAVSRDLEAWLIDTIGVSPGKVRHICNGVDIGRFFPSDETRQDSPVVIGSVTRFSAIKDPMNLIRAFVLLRKRGANVRLHMLGDGDLLDDARRALCAAEIEDYAWLPGSRDDAPVQCRQMDVFALGSLREGISNTVLEAMASGLPVVASNVGGNRELIVDGETGRLVPPGDPESLADAIGEYVDDVEHRLRHGAAARSRAVDHFSLPIMISKYRELYTELLA